MTSVFADGALHPGRDANDSSWLVLRDALDWAGAAFTDTILDPALPAIMLAPAGLAGDLPLAGEVVAPDGTMYRSEPDNHRVLWRRACDAGWSVLVGGPGTETGHVRRPLGLALDARRGLLAIADADNHRVQVVRADGGEPVVVLGCIDGWGRGVPPGANADAHALAEPVGVAFGRGWLVIADRGGKVHVYDDRFRWIGAFAPSPPGASSGFVAAPIAVAITGCIVWVVDAGWSIAVPYGVTGDVIEGTGAAPAELAGLLAFARFAARGEVVHGPVDGRVEGLAWHRVIVDAAVPPGTAVEVQTFASDDPTPPVAIPWAPARPVRIPLDGVEPADGEADRPVLSDQGRWQRSRGEPYLRIARPIARLDGTGPVNAAGFTMPWPAARKLREGDLIELSIPGGAVTSLPIAGITGRVVQAVIHDDPVLYAGGTELTLIERDGEAPLGGPRMIRALSGTEDIDLGSAVDDGTLYDLPADHGVAALLRDGDIVHLDDGLGAEATIRVHTIDAADATIVLAAAVVGDFSTADVRIISAVDRLIVDELDWTDGVPNGEPVFVHDDLAGTQVTAAIRWVEVELGAVWLEPGTPVPWTTWTRFTLSPPAATDRGRYLWLHLRLLGALPDPGAAQATATPVIRAVRLLRPRASYLRYLPAVYARRDDDDPSGALFLERFLALPEHELTGIEATLESVARQLNPLAASPEWLAFVATWFGLVFDPSWPIERRRRLLVSAHELFAKRGTVEGLRRYLEIYTGTAPAIVEGFQYRIIAAPTTTLGGEVVLGRAALGEPALVPSTGLAHWFSIWVFGDDAACGAALIEKAARAIIDSVKPAHTTYDLHVVDGAPRVGITTMVGVDTVLIGGERSPPPIGLAPRPPHVLGRIHLPAPPRAHAPATLAPIPLDDDFTLS